MAHDDAYFREKEAELVERMREHSEAKALDSEPDESDGDADEAILQSLDELGYNRDTVTLLHLVPLIHVAWIDGGVSQRERDLIFEIAATRGVEDGTTAWRRLADWLEERPSEDFFTDSLRVIGVLVHAGAEGPTARDLVECSTRVAEASGGILGFGSKVTAAERGLIERIAAELESDHAAASREVLSRQ